MLCRSFKKKLSILLIITVLMSMVQYVVPSHMPLIYAQTQDGTDNQEADEQEINDLEEDQEPIEEEEIEDIEEDTSDDNQPDDFLDEEDGLVQPLNTVGQDVGFPFFTGVSITDEHGNPIVGQANVKKDSKISMAFEFEIPEEDDNGNYININAGDTYRFRLPNEIKINPEDIPLYLNPNNPVEEERLANVSISADGWVTITFTALAETGSGITGYFWVYSEFDEEQIPNEEETVIRFEFGGTSTVDITINFEQVEEIQTVDINKRSLGYSAETNEITWEIELRPHSQPKIKPIENVIVTDVIKEGQTYKQGSATISPTVDGSFNFDADTLSFTFNEAINHEAGEVYRIQFVTKPDSSYFTQDKQTLDFKNQAVVTYDEDGERISNEASQSVTVNYIKKSGSAVGNKIIWTIEINNNYLDLENVILRDVIPVGLALDTSSININNTPTSIDTNGPLTYDEGSRELKYNFGAITTKQTVTFTTIVTDPEAYDSNVKKPFTNTAYLTGTGVPNGAHDSDTESVNTNILTKHARGHNTSTHKINWELEVNRNEIEIINAKIQDSIPVGLTYVKGTFKVDGVSVQIDADSLQDEVITEIEYTLGNISKKVIVTFETEVLSNTVYAVNKETSFINSATLTGTNIETTTDSATERYASTVINKTGSAYNHITREITWTITVNQNNMPMTNVVVEDTIGAYQEFVPGSVKINGVDALEGIEGEYNRYFFDDTSKTLWYYFDENIQAQQTITFNTKIKDEDLQMFHANGAKVVSNQADLTAGEVPGTIIVTGTRDIPNYMVSKTHKYQTGKDFIPWEVLINQNQVRIDNPVLEDILQEGLQLDTASVELYELIIASNGQHSVGDKVEVDGSNIIYNGITRVFEFRFNQDIDKAYMLKFVTDIDESHRNTRFNNTITFKGSHGTQQGSVTGIQVSFQAAGGGATIANGSIRVIKVDGDNLLSRLSGAIFELLDNFKNVLKTSVATGDDGEILFDKLKFRTYYIREKQAPTGYLLSEELKEFNLKNVEGEKDQVYEFENTIIRRGIEFEKVSDNGEPLEGVEFTIYEAQDTGRNHPLETAISDEDGIVRFEDVPYGSYVIIETETLVSHVLNTTPITATFTAEDVVVTPSRFVNNIIRGDIELLKIDSTTNTGLANAKFGIYTQDEVLVTDVTTGHDGRVSFTGIPYGEYYIQELEAPVGYQLSAEKHPITINSVGTQSLKITNDRTRDVHITKVDFLDETKTLANVKFELYDAAENFIEAVTTDDDGNAVISGLSFGKYSLIEVEAHEGYQLGEAVLFEITESSLEEIELIVKNHLYRSLEIIKFDEDIPTRKLMGAVFEIATNGNVVGTITTDRQGSAKLDGLDYGTYTIKELRAPSGYRLLRDVITINIDDESQLAYTVEIGNKRIPYTPSPEPEPVVPGKPVEPEKPIDPVEPEKPEEPVDPEEPVTPVEPEKPTTPKTPIEEKTPEDTPIEGEVKVPDNGKVVVGEEPSKGKVTVDENGKWVYTPEKDYIGTDHFSIILSDEEGNIEELFFDIIIEEVPLDVIEVETDKQLPKTGEASSLPIIFTGIGLIGIGVILRKRKIS